jgi:hypothetical protein
MVDFVENLDQQIKEIEKAFLEDLYKLNVEDLEKVAKLNKIFQTDYSKLLSENLELSNNIKDITDITDEMLDFFPTTNTNLKSKTNDQLNTILEEVKKMSASAPASALPPTSPSPSPSPSPIVAATHTHTNTNTNTTIVTAQLNQNQKASDPQKDEENYNKNKRRVAGINNPSNACFLNSTYQMLYSLPWFRNYIDQITDQNSAKKHDYNFIKIIFDKFKSLKENLYNIELEKEEHCPKDIKVDIQNEPGLLLDYIFNSDRVNENNKKDVFDVFFVNLQLTTTCKEPNSSFITNNYEYSIDFVMSFLNKQYEDNPDVTSHGGYNTQELIDYYGAYRTFLRQQNLRSEICKEKTNQEEWNHLEYKLLIPETNRYIIIKLGRITGETVDKTTVEIKPNISINGIPYTLSGVIVHIGEDNAGHYIYINCDKKGNYQNIFDDKEPVIPYPTENGPHSRYKVHMPDLISTKATMILYTRYPV